MIKNDGVTPRQKVFHKRKKTFAFLKNMDFYRVGIKTYYHKYDNSFSSTKTTDRMGSYVGGCITVIILICLILYFSATMVQMLTGENDIIYATKLGNSFDEDSRSVEMNQFAFLPYLQIERQRYDISLDKFDIWDNDGPMKNH
jgi:hypothetical protein